MSRRERKLHRAYRVARERLDKFLAGVEEDVGLERGRCLAHIRRATHPGFLRRAWRAVFG